MKAIKCILFVFVVWITAFSIPARAEVVSTAGMYTYDRLCSDMSGMAAAYPGFVALENIGTSVCGRNIPAMRIGSASAPNKVLVTASIHGREYISTQVIMKIADYYASNYAAGNLLEIANNTQFCIVPMVNPDGVSIAQFGAAAVSDPLLQAFTLAAGNNGMWKSNARGVDLNRNFNVAWDITNSKGYAAPAFEMFKGYAAESEPETLALKKYAAKGGYSIVVNLHQQGNVVYMGSALADPNVNMASAFLGAVVRSVNGYFDGNALRGGGASSSFATFADYVCCQLGIPSVTLEIGTKIGTAGQPYVENYYAINRNIFAAINNLWL